MKTSKKLICIILSVIMALSVFATVAFALNSDDSASDNSSADASALADELYGDTVTQSVVRVKNNFTGSNEIAANIILPGISQSISTYCDENGNPILDSKGNELSGGLLIIDSSDLVMTILKNLFFPLISALVTQSTSESLSTGVYNTVSELFSIQKTDKSGNAVNNLVVNTYNYPVSQYSESDKSWFYRMLPMEPVINAMNEKYGVDGEDYTYLYTFPLIGNTMTSAEGLFDFIDMVKEQTGCTKVNLIDISMGGTILTAYLDLVNEKGGDYSDINKIINVVACLNGTDLFADFYDRSWNLDDDFLYGSYIPAIMAESGKDEYTGHLINIALRILPKKAVYAILTAAMDAMLDSLLVNNPQFWALVPSDRYEGLADKYLSGSDYSALREKTDRFQTARLNLDSNLTYAHDNYGVEVYSACGYDRQYDTGDYNFFGISASSKTSNSDSIIDIDSTSLGATYVPAGQELSSDYISALSTTEYVSPDKSVDGSTCLFPNTTWFFCGQHHEVGRDDVVIKLLANIVVGDVTDVNSSSSFPQFNFNRKSRTLTRPDGLLYKAETVIENKDGTYTEEQINAVKPVYEKAVKMLSNTVLTENSAQETQDMTTELNDALAPTGLTTKTAETSAMTKFLNKVFKNLDSFVMSTVGGQGFSDKFKKSEV